MKTQSAGIYFLMPLLFMLMTLCGSFMVQAQKPDWQDSIHGSYLHDYKKYEAKDKALNLLYRDLKAQLSEDEYSQLRDVQRSWGRYKENVCDHLPYFGDDLEVPELDPSAKWMIYRCKAEVTEARLLELQYLASKDTELAYDVLVQTQSYSRNRS
ncbi:lysozyme inhibitor LprI family protein [Photobacterium sp. 53610]|uniref:lysozyme inhibitor LprI family protein n=1 Tax=Photobacterium sp. 53610 TaxID=3102789 RepID=UPI002EDAF8A7